MRFRVNIDADSRLAFRQLDEVSGQWQRRPTGNFYPSYAEVAAHLGLETIRGLRNIPSHTCFEGDNTLVRALVSLGYSNRDIATAIANALVARASAMTPVVVNIDTRQQPEQPSLPQVQAMTMSLLVGDRLYRLASSEDADGSRQIQTAIEAANLQVQTAQTNLQSMVEAQTQEVRRRAQELEAELGRRMIMPNITHEHIVLGLRCWRDGSYITLELPFRYEPKYIIRGDVRYRIRPEVVSTMARDVFIRAQFGEGGRYGQWLVTGQMGERFDHYHQGCWGSLEWPQGDIVGTLFRFRDAAQLELEVVNGDNPARSAPRGLPPLSELLEQTEEMGDWQRPREPETAEPARRRGTGWTV